MIATTGLITHNEAMTETPLILVVDDENNILDVVELYLLRESYRVVRASNGLAAIQLYEQHKPDLVILDIMLPGIEGLEVLRRLRLKSQIVPVIMLTAKSQEDDKLAGLEGGADDYITKPFSPRELVARVKTALRRLSDLKRGSTGSFSPEDILSIAGLIINKAARKVEVEGRSAELTAKEFDLLWFLASNLGQVFTREQLLDKVWDYTYFGEMSTVTVHIRRLREKIEADPMRPRHIKTVWGVGYKFEP